MTPATALETLKMYRSGNMLQAAQRCRVSYTNSGHQRPYTTILLLNDAKIIGFAIQCACQATLQSSKLIGQQLNWIGLGKKSWWPSSGYYFGK